MSLRRYFYNIITARPPQGPVSIMIKFILTTFSLFYLFIISIRFILYKVGIFKSHRLISPVISVGNLTWGGTGKTPLVERLCLYLKSQNKKVALLTRGYGRDEDRLLSQNLQGVAVLAGRDRAKNASDFSKAGPVDIFVLDDGFQHLAIKRDIDIVTINALDPFGRGLLIPAGILREPVSSMERAAIAVITRADLVCENELKRLKDKISDINPRIEIFESIHQPLSFLTPMGEEKGLASVERKRVCIVCGLGDNDSFKKTVAALEAECILDIFFMDHHRYTRPQIDHVIERCKAAHIDTIITTEKDWIKIKEFLTTASGIEFLILKIMLKINNEEVFFARIASLLSR
jgi:tetraacyldisaccharide 4'-kinase